MTSHFREKFEAELNKIAAGLSRKGTTKKGNKLSERIGRLEERFRRIAQNYRIELVLGSSGQLVTDLRWDYQPCAGSKQTHPGVYCLRTNLSDWDDEALWRTYVMLTDLEARHRYGKLSSAKIADHRDFRGQ